MQQPLLASKIGNIRNRSYDRKIWHNFAPTPSSSLRERSSIAMNSGAKNAFCDRTCKPVWIKGTTS
ncbi:hypothetical protein AA0313_2147 [Acetobacter indonesiensis NRIC 0313]|uniref:Uncharacterized protein n=1 Tax=Acetobacter indonesiensis TaxID=104101 RepID=A0A6N3T0G6_9PROT|nr:hypothetical protein AA0313_2147 [Acetobacter indonesiensis NRIC 0313]GEN02662.1 hypothetical protein AIN02nite_06870 [Acetobacter indonesiensis]